MRWSEVSAAIEKHGTYELTSDELTFGVKMAWRNAPRCIGRIQWSNIQVRSSNKGDVINVVLSENNYFSNK